jgi:hypothetical protein
VSQRTPADRSDFQSVKEIIDELVLLAERKRIHRCGRLTSSKPANRPFALQLHLSFDSPAPQNETADEFFERMFPADAYIGRDQ